MSTTAPAVSTSVIQPVAPSRKKMTTATFRQKKARGEIITMLTAYDYPTALAEDQAGIDCILVGDSLGMVVLGYQNTLPVTMDEMLHHSRAVARGAKFALLIGDMPFMSYQVSTESAVRNAGRFLQEGGMEAVKLEGGQRTARCSSRHYRRRDPRDGSPRPHAAIGQPAGRFPAARSDARPLPNACLRMPCCSRRQDASVSSWNPCRRAWPNLFRGGSPSRPWGSAPASGVTVRSWSRTICSAYSTASRPSSSRSMPTSMAR